MCIYMYIYIYVCIYTYICIYVFIYIYIHNCIITYICIRPETDCLSRCLSMRAQPSDSPTRSTVHLWYIDSTLKGAPASIVRVEAC